jgi:hypothetical protein
MDGLDGVGSRMRYAGLDGANGALGRRGGVVDRLGRHERRDEFMWCLLHCVLILSDNMREGIYSLHYFPSMVGTRGSDKSVKGLRVWFIASIPGTVLKIRRTCGVKTCMYPRPLFTRRTMLICRRLVISKTDLVRILRLPHKVTAGAGVHTTQYDT